jgi:hypothetical protein
MRRSSLLVDISPSPIADVYRLAVILLDVFGRGESLRPWHLESSAFVVAFQHRSLVVEPTGKCFQKVSQVFLRLLWPRLIMLLFVNIER